MKIEIKNLEKVFRTDSVLTVALNDVSLDIEDGSFVAIMGPSGCGKSTLLNILGLLDSPTKGSCRLDGVEVAHLKERQRTDYRRGRIGFIFQSFNLINELNVKENIMLPLGNLDLSRSEKERRVEEGYQEDAHIPPIAPLSVAVVRWSAAARGDSASHRVESGSYTCRRADRKS